MSDENETHDDTNETETIVQENEQLKNRVNALEQSQVLQRLVSDPEIAAVLKAKREGKRVSVTEVVDKPADEVEEVVAAKPGEESDPVTETLNRISKVIDTKLTKALEPLTDRLSQIEGFAHNVNGERVSAKVQAAAAKFKDLPDFKDSMAELAKDNPNLDVEDLYFVAKSRAGKLKQVEQATFSEKPTNRPDTRSPKAPAKGKENPPARGRQAFQRLMLDALDKLELPS